MRTIPWYTIFLTSHCCRLTLCMPRFSIPHDVWTSAFLPSAYFGNSLSLRFVEGRWLYSTHRTDLFENRHSFLVQTCPSTHVSSGGPCRSVFDCSSVTEDVCYKDPNTPSSSAQMGVCCRSLCPPGFTAKANSVCSSHNECTVLFGQRMFCYSPTSNTGICCG